jgi:hypothetical protein
MFFWQTSHYIEDQVARGRIFVWQRVGASDAELRYAGWDVGIGMFLSNLIMYFIILASAAGADHRRLPEAHVQVQYLPDPAQDPIERDSPLPEDEGGVYTADELQPLT